MIFDFFQTNKSSYLNLMLQITVITFFSYEISLTFTLNYWQKLNFYLLTNFFFRGKVNDNLL
jgi:hypothetical protein